MQSGRRAALAGPGPLAIVRARSRPHGAQGTMQEHVKTAKADTYHARDLRSALAWLKAQGDLIETDKTVDPDLEITGLQKHMDGGCPVMFNNVKGKPNHRVITNLFGDMNVINKMFGWKSDAERVRKLAAGLRKPMPAQITEQKAAPVQGHGISNPKAR